MIKLYRHQEIALSYMRANNYFALFMEPRTGKTLPSLFRILDLLKSGAIEDALVVAPKSALGAWERDMELFDELGKDLLTSCVTLINYDKVWRNEKKSPYFKKWGCIILDESHLIKNRTSRRSKFLLHIATMADYRYILTGSPISNGALEDIWSQYCFLDGYMERGYPYSRIFGGAYRKFQDRYCILNMYHKPSSYIHVKELQDIINQYSYRVKKNECFDLPDKSEEIIKVDQAEKKLYKKLATESALLEYEVLAENPLSRLIKLRQLCSGHIKLDSGEIIEVKNEKLSILQEIIEGYEDDKKLVIFCEFKYSISKVSELLKKQKIKFVVLDGDQKDKTIWRKFQADKTIKIIVCQYQTANAGIDLYASDTIIFYEPTTRSVVLEQAKERTFQKGQKTTCIHLLTKGTVEEHIYKAVTGYIDFSDKLFLEYMEGYKRSYSS